MIIAQPNFMLIPEKLNYQLKVSFHVRTVCVIDVGFSNPVHYFFTIWDLIDYEQR